MKFKKKIILAYEYTNCGEKIFDKKFLCFGNVSHPSLMADNLIPVEIL